MQASTLHGLQASLLDERNLRSTNGVQASAIHGHTLRTESSLQASTRYGVLPNASLQLGLLQQRLRQLLQLKI